MGPRAHVLSFFLFILINKKGFTMDWNDVKQRSSDKKEYWRGSVAGVSFIDTYPENLRLLKEELAYTNHLQAEIQRNSDNQYDSNACEVWVDEQFIGHLAKDIAKEIAPRIDAGEKFELVITYIGASSEQPDKLGAVYNLCLMP